MKERMKNMSPEEVMSGVHLGMPRDQSLGADSEDWGPTYKKERKNLSKALDSV
jgi:hypothetical protein